MMQSGTGIALFRARGDEVGSPSIRILHVAFRVDRTGFDAARRELIGRGPDVNFQDHQVSHSIYFDDPDGHHLELTTYEV
jgi:catechol-2,3-dioxygenase